MRPDAVAGNADAAEGIRQVTHSEYIRTRRCLVGWNCEGDVVAHHIRSVAAGAGTGIKPGDEWLVPLCHKHHMEGHDKGWRSFERRHSINLAEKAADYWRRAPESRRER